MKRIIQALNCMSTAFSTYSRIPVPHGEWDDANLRWQICFFPVVGLAIGVLWSAAALILLKLKAQVFCMGALLTVWPLILTGGIHMDGFLDTSDAIHSWKPMEERLKILKDPNIGAFAFIYGLLYLVTGLGLMTQFSANLQQSSHPGLQLACISFGFVLSRILSAAALLRFPKARKDGMLKTTSDASDQRVFIIICAELIVVLGIFFGMAVGARRPEPVLIPVCAAAVLYYYYRTATQKFGGTTGDLAGWFVELSELSFLAVMAVFGLIL